MNEKVHRFVSSCSDCQAFTDKKTCEPLASHPVPEHNWSRVAVDLFGPMPSDNHIVVVQDMASRFPAAKLVKSTKAANVIPAMADIYNNYSNPEMQLSDNGPPFNSGAMERFCQSRNIQMQKIPPLHPSANPAETFMKSVGKTMKISHRNTISEKEALDRLLSNYRDSPHPATGIPPNDMFFRHPPQTVFPRRNVHNDTVENARERDAATKQRRQHTINSSKYRKPSNFQEGDIVLIRNFNKKSKYDPYFQYSPLAITKIENNGRCLTLMRLSDGQMYKRHPDDVKLYNGSVDNASDNAEEIDNHEIYLRDLQHKLINQTIYDDDYGDDFQQQIALPQPPPLEPQRLVRQRIPNPRYYNEDMVN